MFNSLIPQLLLVLTLTVPTAAFAQLENSAPEEATSAVLNAGSTANQIHHLRQVPSVGVIYVDDRYASPLSRAGEEGRSLGIYAERNAAGVTKLRRALQSNPVTRRAIAEHGINLRQVIGVSIGTTGSLRFFIG